MASEAVRPNPFDKPALAQSYDGWYETRLGAAMDRAQKQMVWQMARPAAGELALDVGTGTGNYACELASRGLRVVGSDPSEAMLAIASAKSDQVVWEQSAAESLPHEDGRFDLVLSVTALEFMSDPERALAEMWRVTAPGGRLVVGTLNARNPWGKLYQEQTADPDSPFYGARLFAPVQFLALLARWGRVRWGSAGFLPPTGQGLARARVVEAWGRRFRRGKGALLVGRVDK